MKVFAQIVSYVFHPSLLPSWMMGIFLWFAEKSLQLSQPNKKWILFSVFFVFTGLLPLLNVFVLKMMGFIRDLEMDERKDRNMPFIIGMIYYAGLFYLIYESDMPLYYKGLVATGFILILATYTINLFWKISAHMIGAGGFLGAVLWYSFQHHANLAPMISFAFAVGGMLGFARLYLEKHTARQVYIGYLTGLLIALIFIPVSELLILTLLYR